MHPHAKQKTKKMKKSRRLFKFNYTQWLAIALCAFSFALSSTSHAALQNKKEIDLLLPENKDIRGKNNFAAPHVLDLLEFIEKDLDIRFNKKFLPWNRAVSIAQNSDQLIFGLSQTDERLQQFNFSEPAIYHKLWLVTLEENQFEFKSLNDLKGKRIGILRGAFYGGEFDKSRNQLFQVEDDINSIEARLEKLQNKRMDAFIISSANNNSKDVEHHIASILESNLHSNSVSFAVLSNPLLKDSIRFAHRKTHSSDILARIDMALEKYHRTQKKNR